MSSNFDFGFEDESDIEIGGQEPTSDSHLLSRDSRELVSYCPRRLRHPLHTFNIDSLCFACQDERRVRIETFEACMQDNVHGRIMTRSTDRNERDSERGRRLFRASSTLAMTLEPPEPPVSRSDSDERRRGLGRRSINAAQSTERDDATTSIAKGVLGVVGVSLRGDSRSLESIRSSQHPPNSSSSPLVVPRLSFAAVAGSTQ